MSVKPRKAKHEPGRAIEREAEREASAYVRLVLTRIPAGAVFAHEVRQSSHWTSLVPLGAERAHADVALRHSSS
jgi:hypothetical protein